MALTSLQNATVQKNEQDITMLAECISEVNAKLQLLQRELDEKKSRAKNLVVRGVPEKSREDDIRVIEILSKIGCQGSEFEYASRLSKKHQPRPMASEQPSDVHDSVKASLTANPEAIGWGDPNCPSKIHVENTI